MDPSTFPPPNSVYNYDGPHDPVLPPIDPKKKWYKVPLIPLIIGVLILAALVCVVYAPKNPKLHVIVQTVLANIPGVHINSVSEVTSDTFIAKSLTVPPLDKVTYWVEVPPESHDNSLSTLYTPDAKPVTVMKGKFWTAETIKDTSMSVMGYYRAALKKEGWVAAGGIGALHFADFTLAAPNASGTCARMVSFLGYRGQAVNMVTIWGQTVPCDNGKPASKSATDYTIFIGNPMPLKDITADIDNR